jgi:antitoxin FitA
MAQLLIRNLDQAVVNALRVRATQSGHSLEEEGRQVLTAGSGVGREAALAKLDSFREMIGRLPGPSTIEDLRADRDRED